jgi:hypothetical protein
MDAFGLISSFLVLLSRTIFIIFGCIRSSIHPLFYLYRMRGMVGQLRLNPASAKLSIILTPSFVDDVIDPQPMIT